MILTPLQYSHHVVIPGRTVPIDSSLCMSLCKKVRIRRR